MAFRNNITTEQRLTAPIGKKLKKTTIHDLQEKMPTFKPTITPYLSYQNNPRISHNTKHEEQNEDSDSIECEDADCNESDNVHVIDEESDHLGQRRKENDIYDDGSGNSDNEGTSPNIDNQLRSEYNDIPQTKTIGEKDPLLARMHAWDIQRKQRLAAERMHREAESLSQCTFTPNLVASQNYKVKAKRFRVSQTSIPEEEFKECNINEYDLDSHEDAYDTILNEANTESTIWQRQEEWIRKRDLKLEKERKLKEEKALEGCSFKPCLATSIVDSKSSIARCTRQTLALEQSNFDQISISPDVQMTPPHDNYHNNNNNVEPRQEEENLHFSISKGRTSTSINDKISVGDSYLERYFQENSGQKQHGDVNNEKKIEYTDNKHFKSYQFSSESEPESETSQTEKESEHSPLSQNRKISKFKEADSQWQDKRINPVTVENDQESKVREHGASVDGTFNNYIAAEVVNYLNTSYHRKTTPNQSHNSESEANKSGTHHFGFLETNGANKTSIGENLSKLWHNCEEESEERGSTFPRSERENPMSLPCKTKRDLTTESISTEDSTIYEEDLLIESREAKEGSYFALDNHTISKPTATDHYNEQSKEKAKSNYRQYPSEPDRTDVAEMQSVRTADGGLMKFGGLLPSNYLEFNTKDGKVYYYNTETKESTWDFPFC